MPSVSLGIIANVLLALGLQNDIFLIVRDDILGRTLQDCDVKIHRRAPKISLVALNIPVFY